jgi:hypothetical protein
MWNAEKIELAMIYFKLLTKCIILYAETKETYDNQRPLT